MNKPEPINKAFMIRIGLAVLTGFLMFGLTYPQYPVIAASHLRINQGTRSVGTSDDNSAESTRQSHHFKDDSEIRNGAGNAGENNPRVDMEHIGSMQIIITNNPDECPRTDDGCGEKNNIIEP